ncbi:hypothetical protein BDQ17DRAFT_1351943 [Cyathus striatus]|nr:hypothetical protein BDQ17DRAFT_1351943 [Cyathus striatus]
MDLKPQHLASPSQMTLVGDILVQPLKRSEISKAATTWHDAFVEDPLFSYIQAGKKPSHASNLWRKTIYKSLLRTWRRNRVTLTVNAGASLAVFTPAFMNRDHKLPTERLLYTFVAIIKRLSDNKEQRKREKEYEIKRDEVFSRVIGDRDKEMAVLDLLCTELASQGHGYGGALVDAINLLADLRAKDTWLISSNILNTAFYESHGFKGVADIVLGDDNPVWHEAPVIVKLMVREHHDVLTPKSMV